MRVIIVVVGGYELGMEIEHQEPILQMKQRIQNHLGLPMASQTLSVLGWELIDGLDVEDYPFISHGTKIDLTVKITLPPPQPRGENTKIHLTVKSTARRMGIEADTKTDTVRTLKEKIHIMDGTPIKRMALIFSGKELDDEHRILGECGIVAPFSEVVVSVKAMSSSSRCATAASRRVRFAVQTSSALLDAATIPVEMSDLSTVKEVMEMLLGRSLLPADDYIFIHKQRIMREQCTLRWHGVESGECLYVFKGTVVGGGGQRC
ncbi:hypothetical protein DM860_009383 [Cuscuta australis]|uniref:Ubiquitin-like domain-containing protein n=1 Tax=Cuscuta australis TaxID=267555 RepID=A0A328DBV9_9ASTE|nr:hypothetical protein DM860_009383 [Cuscuta australis]